MDLKDHIRSIPDFPKEGILFYDISTLLAHADAWQVALGMLADELADGPRPVFGHGATVVLPRGGGLGGCVPCKSPGNAQVHEPALHLRGLHADSNSL